MSDSGTHHTGGCLCGALRYTVKGEPLFAGYCYCGDCRKASGSGFIPFMGFPANAVSFSGQSRQFSCRAANGNNAVRNFCPVCSSLVFGGIVGKDVQHTIYAGSLDDPEYFRPTVAIFTRDRPMWTVIPPHLKTFETIPSG